MAGACPILVAASPVCPGEGVCEAACGFGDHPVEQAVDLVAGQRGEPGAGWRETCAGEIRVRLKSLSVLGPGKGGNPVVFVLFGLVPVHVWGGGPQSGSRWSARSAARIRRILIGRGNEAKTLWFKSCLPPVRERGAGDALGRAGAQPYLGPRTMVRRHDD